MSTVDIDKGAENIAELNKRGYPELGGACPTCGINPVTMLAQARTALKAELLAKMPKIDIPNNHPTPTTKLYLDEITKIVNEL